MTNKQDTSVEWEKYYKVANGNLDDYFGFAFGRCMDMGSEIGGLMSVKRLPMFIGAVKYFLSHQQGYKEGCLAGGKAEKEKVVEMCEEMKSVYANPRPFDNGYNQALSDLQSRIKEGR